MKAVPRSRFKSGHSSVQQRSSPSSRNNNNNTHNPTVVVDSSHNKIGSSNSGIISSSDNTSISKKWEAERMLRVSLLILANLLLCLVVYWLYSTLFMKSTSDSSLSIYNNNNNNNPGMSVVSLKKHLTSKSRNAKEIAFLPLKHYNKHGKESDTGFVRTLQMDIWMKEYFGFDDRRSNGEEYQSVTCVVSFAEVIKFNRTTEKTRKQAELFDDGVLNYLNEYSLYSFNGQSEFMERKKLTYETDGGIPQLRGQFGIVSKRALKRGQCIGQYFGDEMFLDEFELLYPWNQIKNHKYLSKKWSYYMSIHPFWHPRPFGEEYHEKVHQLNQRGLRTNNETYVVDGFLEKEPELKYNSRIKRLGTIRKSSLVAFVNDARRNISNALLTKEDIDQRLNTEFVNCHVEKGGSIAIFPFLVAIKDIPANQQLFTNYGPYYTV